MPLFRTLPQIVNSMISFIRQKQPDLDLNPGELVNDVVISAPAQVYADEEILINYITKLQSVLNISVMYQDLSMIENLMRIFQVDEETIKQMLYFDLISRVADYGIFPIPSQKSTGIISFYLASLPAIDYVIPAGTRVRSRFIENRASIEFETTATVTMYADLAHTYFFIDENVSPNPIYKIDAPIECIISGQRGNLGAYEINELVSSLPGGFSCYNPLPTIGGSDEETFESLEVRSRLSFVGRNLGTIKGLERFVLSQPQLKDVKIVGPGSEYMIRDNGCGGKVDVYLSDEELITIAVPEQHLYDDFELDSLNYKVAKIRLNKQPVEENIMPTVSLWYTEGGSYVLLLPEYYDVSIEKDTGVYKNSVKGYDKLVLTLHTGSGIPEGFNVNTPWRLEVIYCYDNMVTKLQTLFEIEENKLVCKDILVFKGTKKIVDLSFSVVVFPEYDKVSVRQKIINDLTLFINGFKLGRSLRQSDLVRIIEEVEGVDYVEVPLKIKSRKDSEYILGDYLVTPFEFVRVDGSSFVIFM